MKILLINNHTWYVAQLEKLLVEHEVDMIDFINASPEIANKYDAIILSGSYKFLPDTEKFAGEISIIRECKKPILGICFGLQLICHAYGSKLKKMDSLEKGISKISLIIDDKIFDGIKSPKVFENHEYSINELRELLPLAKSKLGIEVVKHPKKMIYGFQFHPEISPETTDGARLVKNFLALCE